MVSEPRVSPIRLAMPTLGHEELEAVAGVLRSGYLTQGPRAAEFEQRVAAYLGVPFAVATTSATTALHLAMVLLDVGPGDEVVLPAFTFPATANVVIEQGATPVLADIDIDTYNLAPASLEEKITARTKAVIAVHLFGLPAEMDAIGAIARDRGVPVVEDAACALGASYHGRPCGTLGDVACFSFHPRKIITTGEGGMLTTGSESHGARARRLRQHGGERTNNRFSFAEPGFNYRMSDINAAVGLAQMDRLDVIVSERRRLAAAMTAAIRTAGLDVATPLGAQGCSHTYQSYVVRLPDGVDRDDVIRTMASAGVETTIGTYALNCEAYMQARYGCHARDLPVSTRAWRQTLALPLYPGLSESDVERIVATLAAAL